MTHEYRITGMTCNGCKSKVEQLLKSVAHVTDVRIDLANASAAIDMDRHVNTRDLKSALAPYPKYTIEESTHGGESIHTGKSNTILPVDFSEEKKSTWDTYKPVLLIGTYLLLVTLLIQFISGSFNIDQWMNHFMGGFFLVFSFFKMFDIAGFADSYSMYDIIAKKWKGWGFVYPFVELGLGLLFIAGAWPLVTNIITFVVMAVSIIGVLQSVFNKRKIKCACLGAVFNLPMSTVTIIEDALMMIMSAVMVLRMIGG